MPVRQAFDCLWCGRAWETRTAADLEGWAQLCPDCLAQADSNGFLRSRLRRALQERSGAEAPAPGPPVAAPGLPVAAPGLPVATATSSLATATPTVADGSNAHDDWYLRRGRFSRGPLHDVPWQMELDEATRWLDGVPISGTIVELGAGTGWWSPLLAGKGELWCYDTDGSALDQARRRLLAHGLVAHLHERDPLAPPDRRADVVFAACFLGAAATSAALASRLDAVRAWLAPGGTFVFVEARSEPGSSSMAGPSGPLWPRDESVLASALRGSSLEPIQLTSTPSAFLLGRASREVGSPGPPGAAG